MLEQSIHIANKYKTYEDLPTNRNDIGNLEILTTLLIVRGYPYILLEVFSISLVMQRKKDGKKDGIDWLPANHSLKENNNVILNTRTVTPDIQGGW